MARWLAQAAVVAILVALGAATGAAHAAPPSIDLKPAFGTTLTPGRWQPMTVTLTNPDDGQALIGEAQVVVEDPYTAQPIAFYARRVALPAGAATAETTFQIFVPESTPPDLVVNLLRAPGAAGSNRGDADVVTRRRFDKLPMHPEGLRVLAVSPIPDALAYLEGTHLPVYRDGRTLQPALPQASGAARRRTSGSGGPDIAPGVVQTQAVTEPGRLPDRAVGYDSISLVYLAALPPDAFSDAQTAALKQYAEAGGLVVFGQRGDRLRRDERFRAFAPALAPGAPAAWRRVGRGWAVTIAEDVTAPDFAARPAEAKRFWERLALRAVAPPRIGAYLETGDSWYASSFADAAVFAPGLRAPSPTWFGGFMVAYVLLVAPVNYFVLKRLGRREWTWVTVPLLVAAFSYGAYRIGFATKGTTLYQNVASLVEMGPDSGAASVLSYVGLFSPRRTRYDVRAEASDALVFEPQGRRRYSSSGNAAQTFSPLMVDEDAPPGSEARGADVPMWAMRVFGVRTGSLSLGEGVRIRVRQEGKWLIGTVENRTGRTLEEVSLFGQGGSQKLGTLAPGQTVRVRYACDPSAEQLRLESPLVHTALQRRSQRQSSSPAATSPKERTARLRSAMQERMTFSVGQIIEELRVREWSARQSRLVREVGAPSAVLPPPEVTLSAWNADPLQPVRVDGKVVADGAHLNLILVRAPVAP
jgi:hypothetical protein